MDDVPLDKVYANLHTRLSPSSSTKHQKKPDNDTCVPMYPSVEERIHDMQQRRINACVRLLVDHPLQPPMIELLQSNSTDAEVVGDQTGPESAYHEVAISPTKPTTQTSDPSVIQDLINHYSGELPGFEPNLEKAYELASDEVISESPQQQEPDIQMISNTYTDLVIHPAYQPFHLNATQSNISFGISLRNLSNQKLSAYENHSFFSQDSTFVVQPLNVAAPSNIIMIDSDSDEKDSIICDHPSISSQNPEHFTEPNVKITSDTDEDEQPTQWFIPGFLKQTLSSSSSFVLESVHDQPFEPTSLLTISEINSDLPSSSNQLGSPIQTSTISSPPTLLLDSIIIKEVCENIFMDLTKLVKSRSNLIHTQDYVSEWTTLREKVDHMMC